MKNLILIILMFAAFSISKAQTFQFGKMGGGSSTDYGYGICLDNSGNMYVAGCYQNTAAFDNATISSAGFFDIFIAKYNSSGTLLWIKTAGGEDDDEAARISLGADGNVYVAGTYQGIAHFDGITLQSNGIKGGEDLFLAKLNPNGDFLWVKSYGGTSQDFVSDMGMNNNSMLITGYYYGQFNAGAITLPDAGNGTQKFVMKLDMDGNPSWAKNTGGTTWIAVSDDNYYIAGVFSGSINFDGTAMTSNGATDLFLASYDMNGNQHWIKQFGGSSTENMRSIYYDKVSNNIYWAGSFQSTMTMGSNTLISSGQMDVFVSKFDANGNNLWAKKAGGAGYEVANGTAVDAQGNVYFTGYYTGTATFGTQNITSNGSGDAYIAKYNASGDFQWVKTGGGPGQDNGMLLKIDNNSNIYLTGFFYGGATFENLSLGGYGSADFLLLKLGTTSDITHEGSLVNSYKLHQNFPNPFNPATKINFDLPSPGNAVLKVYNTLGNEVAVLVNERLSAGSYSVTLNGSALSSGIYFYTLKSGSFTETKKMMLVK